MEKTLKFIKRIIKLSIQMVAATLPLVTAYQYMEKHIHWSTFLIVTMMSLMSFLVAERITKEKTKKKESDVNEGN